MDDGLMQFLARWLVNAPNGHGHGCKHLILLNAWINLELIRTFLESIEKVNLLKDAKNKMTFGWSLTLLFTKGYIELNWL
jgi:hypothetical protein